MKEIRKKQKRLYTAMKIIVAVTLVYIVVYIGIQPYTAEWGSTVSVILSYLSDGLIVVSLAVALIYYSRYGKTNAFLTRIEHEINDCGYYMINADSSNQEACLNSLFDKLKNDGYAIESNVDDDGLEFTYVALKRKEFFYVCDIDDLSKDDVLAYLDSTVNDLTVRRLKRAGNCVIVFITDKAQDGAIALSKMICTFGKKDQLKIAIAIAEPETRKCYFLGNMQTKTQAMTAEYIMNTRVPIPDELKHKEVLEFQKELEKHMEEFTIKSYLDGTFYAH